MNEVRILVIISLFILQLKKTCSQNMGNPPEVHVIGAMHDVMRKGELAGVVRLDTFPNTDQLYGLGPESYLAGELMIIDGITFVSRVATDSTMIVESSFEVEAPFFVYSYVSAWTQFDLPPDVLTIQDLENHLMEAVGDENGPFAFKLNGQIASAEIHVQNLPKGAKVSSPEEAHAGQVNFSLKDQSVDILGFFSTEHKGIFTHHDSFLHMHLITKDRKYMGHLDKAVFLPEKMHLFFPGK